ncbi:MAG: Gfo/Idh/MocA family oxidoreductase [Caldilineaceae bacterium]|nr:Gfo/Idh/MocA family oxidoreductase [Caldilineaceae bacterium]
MTLRAGFIGAGNRSQSAHYPNVQRLADVEMTAVCELDEARLDQVVEKYGFSHVYTNHQEMLAKVELDIVYCVMHERWLLQPALDCLNAGKHIFIEKPPGANSQETQMLLDAAIANNVYAMVGYQRRYAATTREAMRRVHAKGPVSTVVGAFNKQLLGDAAKVFTTTLWDDVTHMVDLVRFMAGGEAIEVTAYRDSFGSNHRNCYTALIRFDNGVTGAIFGNRASGSRVLRAELHGVGIGCYMDIPGTLEIFEDNQQSLMEGWQVDGVAAEDLYQYEGTYTMHQHFIDCVRNGKVPSSDLRDAIHTVRLVDQIEGPMP